MKCFPLSDFGVGVQEGSSRKTLEGWITTLLDLGLLGLRASVPFDSPTRADALSTIPECFFAFSSAKWANKISRKRAPLAETVPAPHYRYPVPQILPRIWGFTKWAAVQIYDAFWGTPNTRCRIIIGIQSGTIILTTTQVQDPDKGGPNIGGKPDWLRIWGFTKLRTPIRYPEFCGENPNF